MKPGRHQFPSTSIALRIAVIATVALLAMPCVVPQSFGADDDGESRTQQVPDDDAAETSPPSDDTMDRAAALQALADDDVAMRRRGALRLADIGEPADVAPLIEALRDDDPIVRAIAERSVWSLWSHSGDDEADRMLALGAEQLASQRLADSIVVFTGIIERWPAFAEAWNKRATAFYLAGDLDRSAADCREVLRLNPSHFGALSGVGLILLKRGELERALSYFERALELNPNLSGVRSHRDAVRDELARRGRHET
jgi:tetratricopeptide (TPR) repeat protein